MPGCPVSDSSPWRASLESHLSTSSDYLYFVVSGPRPHNSSHSAEPMRGPSIAVSHASFETFTRRLRNFDGGVAQFHRYGHSFPREHFNVTVPGFLALHATLKIVGVGTLRPLTATITSPSC